jgi:recombination protein RecR
MNSQRSTSSGTLNQVIEMLSRLPGIGPKSAQRLAFYLMRAPEDQITLLAQSIKSLKENTHLCKTCFNYSDSDICSICSNTNRDSGTICIVEQPQDILALEHVGVFKGKYHVLHGAISPSEGVGPSNIKFGELLDRLGKGITKEIIIATNPTLEGEATAMYLQHQIKPLGIKVTRIARGLPFGTEIEYADDVTLSRALEGRQEF